MKLLDRMMARFGYEKAAPMQSVGVRTLDTTNPEVARIIGAGPTISGAVVNETTSMRHSAVFISSRIISETLGQLIETLGVYEKDRDGNLHAVDHDLNSIFQVSPNSEMDPVEYIEAKGANLSLQGNTYSYQETASNGRVISLFPIPSQFVTPQRNKDTGALEYKVQDRGKIETYPREKIWHVKLFSNDGLVGYSPIGALRNLIGTGISTDEFQAQFFANGAMPSWILSIPQWLKDDQRERAKKNLQEMMGGVGNAYKVLMLEGGVTATSATMPLEDAQFVELAKLTSQQLFGVYRIPQHMAGMLDRSTNNNIEQQALEFIQHTMMPYLVRIQAGARRWLLPVKDRRSLVLRFNTDALLRADAAARSDLHSRYVQNGIMTRNEARMRDGMNKANAPGMDDYTVQTNLAPLEMLPAIAKKLSTSNAQPAQSDNQPTQPAR